jgi:putative nucleotidyltransferase with HDIG domain
MTLARIRHMGPAYVNLIALAGLGVIAHSIFRLFSEGIGYQWFVLAGLTLLSGSFTVRIPGVPARLSVSETFVFAGALLFGPSAATLIVVLDTLVISLWLQPGSRRTLRIVFNMAAPAIAIWTATHVFFTTAGIPPLSVEQRPILSLVAPLLLLALVYFLLNSWLIAGAIGFEKQVSPIAVWRDNFFWLSLNYFSGASVAALLLPYLQGDQGAFIRVAGILLPLLLISYLTFKTALGRVEDANQHLSQLNKLYLSTIETLAMAIDAKDQITHGHIRRVQQLAMGLAQKLGITDGHQLQAIEAASLLHDMGKLAVPEYILNKPGKLTPAEFERMKLHASVGADILSAINFPYPVVPIVRHHHENWDGTGYPDGLKGSDIPLGARILSIVDCFDALTSDRPYRPKLSDDDALAILRERRGSMYDPLIVDSFVNCYRELTPRTPETDTFAGPLQIGRKHPSSEQIEAGFDDISASREEMLMVYDLARALSSSSSLQDAAELIDRHVRRVIPVSSFVLFTLDATCDELVAAYASGEHVGHLLALRIPRGQRLSGWVAANQQGILNSDPVLDLGDAARGMKPRLHACLSTPLVDNGTTVGVISLYSSTPSAFTMDHRRLAEVIAKHATKLASRTRPVASNQAVVAGHSSLLEPRASSPATRGDVRLYLVHLRITDMHTEDAAGKVLAALAGALEHSREDTHVVLRYSDNELVVLSATEVVADAALRDRLVSLVTATLRTVTDSELARTCVSLGIASSYADSRSFETLLAAAMARSQPIDGLGAELPPVH